MLSFLGSRGLGTVYYIAYALNHGDFGDSERLWAIIGFIVAASIVIHDVSASPLLVDLAKGGADVVRRRAEPRPAAPEAATLPERGVAPSLSGINVL